MAVTKRNVLLECLGWMERIKTAYSKDLKGREPDEKYGNMFQEYEEKCQILRELIRALESEPVRDAISNWQELIDKYGPENAMLLEIAEDNKRDFPMLPEEKDEEENI